MTDIACYLNGINRTYEQGLATEHSYRTPLENLIKALIPQINATNEPQRISCGAPDYILTTKNNIPIGYIETKDIGTKDLEGAKANKEQFDRYKAALNNILFTDYLQFHFYTNGILSASITIAEVKNNKVVPLPNNFTRFIELFKNFCSYVGSTIEDSKKLAGMMAAKARLLATTIALALNNNDENFQNNTLQEQLQAFKDILIPDIAIKEFSDVYAQTITYGMFAARLHDPSSTTFNRAEAAKLIPRSNPFLCKLFEHIAGYDLDTRIQWIVDDLADIFRACDIETMLKRYDTSTHNEDPIIHFYETFLSEYDPTLRKTRGVWYTPKPIVTFIVRAVDDILKEEFNIQKGLADTTTTNIQITNTQGKTEQRTLHRVQILDPAAGTGTFLTEIVKCIHNNFEGQQGIWDDYVRKHLLPRLNGFELLMASYAMAHLQLDKLLTETGYQSTPENTQRLRVFLTNSLEEHHPDTQTFFASWLSKEANEANSIKRDVPVMCVMGNPPYSGESANKGRWIMDLMQAYKKEPGGKTKLNERNPKWINDDYIKFIRYGQSFIERVQGGGVLAYINPHGFLDNPTFRGMRWNLIKTFDKIYTIDLHGNSRKKETAPDGSKDENVFDIMQGVSINLFIKTGKKKATELGKVFHFDLYGERQTKFDFLNSATLKTVPYKALHPQAPMYYMVQKNLSLEKVYKQGIAVNELFPVNSVGIVTANDDLYIAMTKKQLEQQIKNKYDTVDVTLIKPIHYRPFDNRFLYYNVDLIERSRIKVMQHFLRSENVGLIVERIMTNKSLAYKDVFITKWITDKHNIGSGSYAAPLYLYPEVKQAQTKGTDNTRQPNLKPEIVAEIAKRLSLTFVPEKEKNTQTFAPIDILDYVYAVLHSPSYRTTYKEFLKTDFPCAPYPTDKKIFWQLVALGSTLRNIHLQEESILNIYITEYNIKGNNFVEKVHCEKTTSTLCKVFINETQYFDKVPEIAWNFYIGGYQPAQKWLKDRKGIALSYDDIMQYQQIIVALVETNNLMQKIDTIAIK